MRKAWLNSIIDPFSPMFQRTALLMPTPSDAWELWESAVKRRPVSDPASLNGQPLHIGLPSDRCRSLPMRLPSKDRKLYRDLIYSQLEKRHLISRRSGPARFDYEVLEKQSNGTIVRVDLVHRDLAPNLEGKRALTFGAALRYYALPPHKIVLAREHGRLVLAANRGGRLLYSAILNRSGEIEAETAQTLHSDVLALEGQGFIAEALQGVELWGDFEPNAVTQLREGLTIPVEVCAWPRPDGARHPERGALIAPSADVGARKRRSFLYVMLGLSVLALGQFVLLKKRQTHLDFLEVQIVNLEDDLGISSSKSADFDASQTRWKALRDVIDSRRYPLRQLNTMASIMSPDGIVLHIFESKLSEVRLEGMATSAKTVFDFMEALNQDPDLSAIYNWSRKREPRLNEDGSAQFELIGKRK